MAVADRAVFPLKMVLYPGATTQLVIFEPRYLAMVSYCMTHQIPFVIAKQLSAQKNLDYSFERIATTARIIDFDQQDDGMLMITVQGEQRVRLLDCYVSKEKLNICTSYRQLPELTDATLPEQLLPLKELAVKLARIPELDIELSESSLQSCQYVTHFLAQLLPLDLEFKQYLLEHDNPVDKAVELYDQLLEESEFEITA
ncbi:MAG: LON peptidase substrate-binding domain-containing protein [Kangiellaceae bacterium]|jgi:Lon protease-like protein|nr:LON peptidase substrate-binding domain-containing protein [Kangiellaceae bacterium]